jgi:hypothetical protein
MTHAGSANSGFARALLDPALPPPAGLVSWNGSDIAGRFAVYRNNVVVSLTEALSATFPVVRQLVGEEFFEGMARLYLRAHPPSSPVLAEYGTDFPAFIAAFPAAASLPYLADVARLEAAWLRAYHAADAVPIAPDAFACALEADLAAVHLTLHPSMQVLCSPYAVRSIWAAHQGQLDLAAVDLMQGEDVLILRPALEVEVYLLAPGVAAFLMALGAGAALGAAMLAGIHAAPAFDLPAALSLLLTSGLVIALHLPGDHP